MKLITGHCDSGRINTSHARRLLRGGSLKQVLERETRLPEPCLRVVARRALLGLLNMKTAAGFHHGDTKPDNLGLLRDRDYKSTVVLDFGAALPIGATRARLVLAVAPRVGPCPLGSGRRIGVRSSCTPSTCMSLSAARRPAADQLRERQHDLIERASKSFQRRCSKKRRNAPDKWSRSHLQLCRQAPHLPP